MEKAILDGKRDHIVMIGKDVLISTNFNWLIFNNVFEMLHLSRRIYGVSFLLVDMLVHYDYYFSNGSVSNSSWCNDRDIVNLMII